MQFAYHQNRSTNNAIQMLLHGLQQHLDKPKTNARVLFLDFSSAFNTIQPHLMIEKLLDMSVNPTIISWIYRFLTERPQKVKVGHTLSSLLLTNTGVPQGCVLSLALFTLYTADCRSQDQSNMPLTSADDTALVSMIDSDETHYRSAMEQMVTGCDRNYLHLKETVIDFRRMKTTTNPLCIEEEMVEIVSTYKYLRTVIEDKLEWTPNIVACCKKTNQQMYFLHKLRQFRVSDSILHLFCQSAVMSVMLYNQVCYFSSAQKCDTNRMEKIIRDAMKITGSELQSPNHMYEQRALKKLDDVLSDDSHPLYCPLSDCVSRHESPRWLICEKARTSRMRDSFVPGAVRLYSASHVS